MTKNSMDGPLTISYQGSCKVKAVSLFVSWIDLSETISQAQFRVLLQVPKDNVKLLLKLPAKYPNPTGFDVYRVLTRAGQTPRRAFGWHIWKDTVDDLVLKLAYEILQNIVSLDSGAFVGILGEISRILTVNKEKKSAALASDILVHSSVILQEPSATLDRSIQAIIENPDIPHDIKTLLIGLKTKTEARISSQRSQHGRIQFTEHPH